MKYILETPVSGLIGDQKYQTQITWRNGKFITDEPERLGGMDIGPDPFTLLLSSLITCTLVTLRMYIDHKGYNIPEISARANMYYQMDNTDRKTIIERQIEFSQPLDPEISDRLLKIAEQCPISKILKQEVMIRTVKA
jgi:putative redox protein